MQRIELVTVYRDMLSSLWTLLVNLAKLFASAEAIVRMVRFAWNLVLKNRTAKATKRVQKLRLRPPLAQVVCRAYVQQFNPRKAQSGCLTGDSQ